MWQHKATPFELVWEFHIFDKHFFWLPFEHKPHLSTPSSYCKSPPPPALHCLSLTLLSALYASLIRPSSPHTQSSQIFWNFFLFFLTSTTWISSLYPLNSSSTHLNLSHRLIRSPVTHACGMVVPTPALCQCPRACLNRNLGGPGVQNPAAPMSNKEFFDYALETKKRQFYWIKALIVSIWVGVCKCNTIIL